MKNVLLLIALLSGFSAMAQTWYETPQSTQPVKKVKLFRAIIYTETGLLSDGILYELTDSTLRYVRNTPGTIAQLRTGQTPEVFEIQGDRTERILVRRKGHGARGVLFGTGLGVIGSVLLAVATSPTGFVFFDIYRTLFIVMYPFGGAIYGSLASSFPENPEK